MTANLINGQTSSKGERKQKKWQERKRDRKKETKRYDKVGNMAISIVVTVL